MPCILKETDFKETLLEILCTFCKGLDKVYKNLLNTPHDLTGDEYEVQARIYLGFQAVQIFGTANLTASLKALLHSAISLATCLAILLRHKLHEILPSVTYPATDICRNFFVAAIVAKSSSQLRSVTPSLQLVSQRLMALTNQIALFVHVRFYSETKWRLNSRQLPK